MATASRMADLRGARAAVAALFVLTAAAGASHPAIAQSSTSGTAAPGTSNQAPTLSQQVRLLSAEMRILREQVDGLGRQLEERVQQAAQAAESRREDDRSFRDWFAEATRRTERLEQSSAVADRQLAAAAAAVEAGLKASIDRVAERLDRLEQEIAGLAEVRRTVARLDEGEAARAQQQATAAGELRALLDETRAALAQRMDRMEQEMAARAEAQDAALADLRLVVGRGDGELAERMERLAQDTAARAQSQDTAVTDLRTVVGRTTEQLAERVAGVETATASAAEQRAGMTQQMARLEQERAARAAAQDAAVADLRAVIGRAAGQLAERVERVEKETATAAQLRAGISDAKLERLLGASVHLSAITQTARPFGRELAYVRQIGEGVRGIEAPIGELLVHAARGAPTITDLRHSFEALAPMVVARATTGEDGWTDTARRWATEAGSKFGVVDPPPPTAARAAVQTAELHLARGQLAQAVAALAPLDAAALNQAATWIIHARARISIDQAGTELVNRVMAQVLTR